MYTVRIAFSVPRATRIAEDEVIDHIGAIEVSLTSDGQYHILKATGFPSMETAADFLTRLESSMCWLLLQKGIAAEASLKPQTITYYPDPQLAADNLSKSFGTEFNGHVDCIVSSAEAAIYPTERRLSFVTSVGGSAYTTVPAKDALQTLLDGVKFEGSHRMSEDPKFGVALKLYGAYFTEKSTAARFLTLIMSLEALTAPTAKSPAALALLEKWSAEVDQISVSLEASSEDALALEALKREILYRRADSVRSQVRKMVLSALDGEADAAHVARDALRLYDLRSTLVHDGFVEAHQLSEATSQARTLVHRVLLCRFRRVTRCL